MRLSQGPWGRQRARLVGFCHQISPPPHSWAPSLVVMRPHPGASRPALMWLVYCPRNALVLREGSRGRKPRGCCHVGEGSSSRRGCGLGCLDASAPRDQTEQQMPLLWAHPTSASSWLLHWHPGEQLPVTSSHPPETACQQERVGGLESRQCFPPRAVPAASLGGRGLCLNPHRVVEALRRTFLPRSSALGPGAKAQLGKSSFPGSMRIPW